MQGIGDFFLFALNVVLFSAVVFAIAIFVIKYLGNKSEGTFAPTGRKKLPLHNILLEFKHSDIDDWFSWIKTQNQEKKEKALQMLIDYLSQPMEELGLITRDILKILIKFPCEGMYPFLEDFSKNAIKFWNRNKAISSFFEQSLLNLIKLDSTKAVKFILGHLKSTQPYPSKDKVNNYMVMALATLENEIELRYSFKEVALDNHLSTEFKIDALELLKLNENRHPQAVSAILQALIDSGTIKTPLFDYCFHSIFKSEFINSEEAQELMVNCFASPNSEDEATENLLKYLSDKESPVSQKLLFKLLNVVSPKNYTALKDVLVDRTTLSNTELLMVEEKENSKKLYDQLRLNNYEYKIFNFSKMLKRDPFLSEEMIAMSNAINNISQGKPCLKIIYGKSRLEKLYACKVLASVENRYLLVLNFEAIIEAQTEPTKLEHLLSQDPSKIVYMHNFKSLISNLNDTNNRKYCLRIFNIVRKYARLSKSNFIACMEEKYKDLLEGNKIYKNFFEEYQDDIMHSYTFDTPPTQRKQEIFQSIRQKIDATRESELNGFDDFEDSIDGMTHFEFINYIYQFFHDSVLVFNKILSVEKYKVLMADKQIVGLNKDLLKLSQLI